MGVEKVESEIAETIGNWQKLLLDLTAGNPLIHFNGVGNHALMLKKPEDNTVFKDFSQEIFDNLIECTPAFRIVIPPKPSELPQIKKNHVLTTSDPQALKKALTQLRLREAGSVEEMGVHTLFLSFGIMEWNDPNEQKNGILRSPLLLCPVHLERKSINDYRVHALDNEEDFFINPALKLKIEGFHAGFFSNVIEDQPSITPDSIYKQKTLQSFFKACEQKASKLFSHCKVYDEIYLAIFSFAKIPMYHDLTASMHVAVQHPLIKALQGQAVEEFELQKRTFGMQAGSRGNREAMTNPRTEYKILNADASQIEAMEAIKQGATMIIQGPPGTGKSQTIANIIAEFLGNKKKVLFVSEKAAALEVVKSRLDGAGIGHLCLNLHSNRLNRKSVIDELSDCLEKHGKRIAKRMPDELLNYADFEKYLHDYERYLHEPNSEMFFLGLSLYEIYQKLNALKGVPLNGFKCELDLTEVDPGKFQRWITMVRTLKTLHTIWEDTSEINWRFYTGTDLSAEKKIKGLMNELFSFLEGLKALNLEHVSSYFSLLSRYKRSYFDEPHDLLLSQIRQYHAKKIHFRSPFKALYGFLIDATNPLSESDLEKDIEKTIQLKNILRDTVSGIEDFFKAYETWCRLEGLLRENGLDFIIQDTAETKYSFFRIQYLTEKLKRMDGFQAAVAFNVLKSDMSGVGLGPFLSALEKSHPKPDPEQLEYILEKSVFSLLLEKASESKGQVTHFFTPEMDQRVIEFSKRDQLLFYNAPHRIIESVTSQGPTIPEAEQKLLREQALKKAGHMSLRNLFPLLPSLLSELKPCMMMSPLSVAQYLKAETFQFDLVIFDEASQIKPEDALGAIIRGKQIVIAGDSQQLPPTNFFELQKQGLVEDESGIVDYNSILDLVSASVMQKQLLWHYRSKDESLISFSNQRFYKNRLETFPNALPQNPNNGIRFIYVEDGVYDRGKTRTNQKEIERVIELVFEHAVKYPDLSLGVVTFSESQKTAIFEKWEEAFQKMEKDEKEKIEEFFAKEKREPFFVKNLESVQGDERDVIIFSVAYGKDKDGKFSLNFGPMNQNGGPKRLNVAITRARQKILFVSSIRSSEFPIALNTNISVLRDYIAYAENTSGNPENSDETGIPPMVRDIADQLEVRLIQEKQKQDVMKPFDWSVHTFIGRSPYKVEIGIQISRNQYREYILGVETDGAMYHSGKTVRDREYLRHAILEKLGWQKIVRVWSKDWLADPQSAIDLLIAEAIKALNKKMSETDSHRNGRAIDERSYPR